MIGGDVIGIDLGTTYSCVAVSIDGNIEIIPNDQGNRITPSFVAFSDYNSELLVGEAAKNQAALNPTHTIFDIKRLIGKKFDDPEVQRDLNYLPYTVVNKDGKPCVQLQLKSPPGEEIQIRAFTPEEISTMVLGKMKETAESYLGNPIAGVVITVPAYFNDAQRRATKEAGKIVGLNVLRIINEPTAATIAYGMSRKSHRRGKRKILVYNLGGGTFDVSLMDIEDGVFEVKATGGDTNLGGGDFDKRVMEYFINLIKTKHNKDVGGDRKALGKLRKECERVKRTLSNQSEVRVEIDSLIDGMDFSESLSRAKFEELNMDLFEKTLDVVKKTMEDGNVEKRVIEEIVLVGGSSRIHKLREMLKDMFDGKDLNKCVNPDEAVAYGAALLGAKLSGNAAFSSSFTFSDVTPLSLGVDIRSDLMSVIVPKNTIFPREMSKCYKTTDDLQTTMDFKVYQGERPFVKDCIELGYISLEGLTPAPRKITKVRVSFEIDEDGILTVTANEEKCLKDESKSKSITISSYKLNVNAKEVASILQEVKQLVEEDNKEKERIVAGLALERLIYDVKTEVNNSNNNKGDKKTTLVNALEEASRWYNANVNASKEDYEEMKLRLSKQMDS
ncbi:Luminal-binding protein 5 [Linum perenne]